MWCLWHCHHDPSTKKNETRLPMATTPPRPVQTRAVPGSAWRDDSGPAKAFQGGLRTDGFLWRACMGKYLANELAVHVRQLESLNRLVIKMGRKCLLIRTPSCHLPHATQSLYNAISLHKTSAKSHLNCPKYFRYWQQKRSCLGPKMLHELGG